MPPLNHAEALVHTGINRGRRAAARGDQGDGLSGWELSIAERRWCGLRRRERGLDDDGRPDRFDIERRSLAGGYVSAHGAGTGYRGLRPLQLHSRGDFRGGCGSQREITLQVDRTFLRFRLIATRYHDRERNEQTTPHRSSLVAARLLRHPAASLNLVHPGQLVNRHTRSSLKPGHHSPP